MIEIDIIESPEYLLELMNQEQNKNEHDKLQTLYFLKTKKITHLRHIAENLNRHRTSIQAWIKIYKEKGLEALLKEQNNRVKDIPDWVVDYVVKKTLAQPYMPFISDVQQWVKTEFNLKLTHSQARHLLHYKVIPLVKADQSKQKTEKIEIPALQELNIKPELYEMFTAWKEEKGLINDSMALEQLIAEFCGKRTPYLSNFLRKPGTTLIESLSQKSLNREYPPHIPKFLSQIRLAERLGVDDTSLYHARNKRIFAGWTKLKDPDQVAWQWDANRKKYKAYLPE